jgi:hypothetical protein
MNKEETLELFTELLEPGGIFQPAGMHEENHRPHPFTVGRKHVAHAAEHNGGILSEEICQELGCAHSKCTVPYDEHESDKVLFLQLRRDAEQLDANEELLKIKDKLEEHKIAGVAFVDTEEKFRFLTDGKRPDEAPTEVPN